ncbi:MAG: hypothetical protein RL603_3 [Pseudomonadota bacterium]
MIRNKHVGLVSALVAALLTQAAAYAQEQEQGTAKKSEAAKDELQQVTVTGSRIKRTEFTSTSPVVIINSEDTTLEGMLSTTQILQTNTLAAGSQQINDQTTGFVTENGPGANTVALRGIGSSRTLVLLNGRRLSPAGSRGQLAAADLNVIPTSIVQRTEILKDGASSVYGSDAIAGVINLITNKNLDEGRLNLSGNSVNAGGGETQLAAASWGKRFERGNVSVSYEFYNRDPLLVRQRDYLNCAQDRLINVTSTTSPSSLNAATSGQPLDIIDPVTGQSKCYNIFTGVVRLQGGVNAGADYVPNAAAVAGGGLLGRDLAGYQRVGGSIATVISLRPGSTQAANLAAYRTLRAAVPQDNPLFGDRTFVSPVRRNSVFAEGTYEIADSAKVYGEYLWNRRESSQTSFRQLFPLVAATNAGNTFGVAVQPILFAPLSGEQDVRFQRGVVGITGDITSGFLQDWTYDAFVQRTQSRSEYGQDSFYNDRVVASTQAGNCVQSLITISNGTCVNVGWTRPDVIAKGFYGFTEAERNFLFARDFGRTSYDQTTFGASITGKIYDLPAGALSGVFGVEQRKDSIDDIPGPQAINSNGWGLTAAGRTKGSDTVKEAFTELEVPLLADLPLLKRLSFNGSFRWTDYDSYGSDTTYKAGLNWQMFDTIRLRAAKGTSFRAPALYELFLANQTSFSAQLSVDPCINWAQSSNPQIQKNCAAAGIPGDYAAVNSSSATIIAGGGRGVLDAETSNNSTIGIVWTPESLPMSAAVDWWRIEVQNQVAQFGASSIVNACYTSENYPNDPFCTLFTRDTSPSSVRFRNILEVKNSYVNISNQIVEGTDWTVRFDKRMGRTRFVANALVTYFNVDSRQLFRTQPSQSERGFIYNNKWVANLDLRAERGPWTFNWSVDVYSPTSNDGRFGGAVFGGVGLPNCVGVAASQAAYCVSALYEQSTHLHRQHNTSVRYRADKWEVILGIQNVFDKEPPLVSTGSGANRIGNSVAISNYDVLGRRAFGSLSYRF